MTAQLDQILNYLDRDGVTEVIMAAGQPMQFRRAAGLVSITAAQLTRVQIAALVANTPLAAILGQRTVLDVQLGKRALRVTSAGTPEAPSLVIARASAVAARPTPAVAPANITERARRPSRLGRPIHDARSPTIPPSEKPRTRAATKAPEPVAKPRTISRATPMPDTITPELRGDDTPAVPVNRLTRSDIKFRTPAPRARKPSELPLDLDPTGAQIELEPPMVDLGARNAPVPLSLDLDDDLLSGAGHQGSTPAIDAAFAGPKSTPAIRGPAPPADRMLGSLAQPVRAPVLELPLPPHMVPGGSTPALDATFGGPPPLQIEISAATPAPARISVALPPALRALVQEAAARRASDLHILANRPPCARVLGELTPLRPDVQKAPEVEALLLPLLDERGRAQLERVGYSDLALEGPAGTRLRANIARAQGGLRGTFRLARAVPPTLDELGLPKDLAKVVAHHQGLVVIAGPSGHGKTTTLAALVDLVNSGSAFHIITVEDPIEIVYPRKAAVVSQREVGAHTRSFAAALKGSLREDPDVIVIGELRDRETVEIALTAAETGHLVLATMSTPSAAKTIDRLVDMFPPADQQQVRSSIAGALRAIVSQRLLPSASGDGVVAAVELVTGVLPLATLIREDKLFQLPSLMMRGRSFGMIRLDDSLAELVRAGRITSETALATADNRKELATRLSQGTSAIPVLGRKS